MRNKAATGLVLTLWQKAVLSSTTSQKTAPIFSALVFVFSAEGPTHFWTIVYDPRTDPS